MRALCLGKLEDAKDAADRVAEEIFEGGTLEQYRTFNRDIYQVADFYLQDAIVRQFAASQSMVELAIQSFEEAKNQMEEALGDLQAWDFFFERATEFIAAARDIWRFFQGA